MSETKNTMPPEPTVAALLAAPQDLSDRTLAARYAPIIQFDAREPFLPLAVGYTIFHQDADSLSFPRRIELALAAFAIEYAIWWDWDIGHLYELEHAWVYLDEAGRVVRGEASWHGDYHDLAAGGALPLDGERLVILSEPGKHAFAPTADWFDERRKRAQTAWETARRPGIGGVLVTPLFEGVITCRTPHANRLVHTYLERYAFRPAWDFSQVFPLREDALVPWPALQVWIPDRVAWWVAWLEQEIAPGELRFLRIGHRGASAAAPENTLAAFRKAAELDADAVELDVHVSADGVPVVIHDSLVVHPAKGLSRVNDLTVDELKQVDVGDGERIPTFEKALTLCRDLGLGLYVEIKDGWSVPLVVEAIRQRDMEGHVIVGSFRPDWVAHVKALEPRLATSVLFGAPNVDPVKLAEAVGASYVHPCWERYAEPHKLLTAEWIARVRRAGLGIVTWHEERPAEIAALRQLGVDGICSDRPELLLPGR